MEKPIKWPKYKFVLIKDDCVLYWGWVKGKKKGAKNIAVIVLAGLGKGYCAEKKKGRCGVTSEQKIKH